MVTVAVDVVCRERKREGVSEMEEGMEIEEVRWKRERERERERDREREREREIGYWIEG